MHRTKYPAQGWRIEEALRCGYAVPEPQTCALMLMGLAAPGLKRRLLR